jgi:serine/threonine-protein kinase
MPEALEGDDAHASGGDLIDPWATSGALIGGRYVVEGLLGSGGMGCVVRARHRDLGELRAIKLLRPDRRLAPEAQRRLLREARAAAQIQSAHVVRVMDVASDGPGAPYIVMEYLEGENLSARLRRAPIAPDLTARIVIETCEALAEAHRAGTVHRDLKPSNLFLVADGSRRDFVKVLDFGIAKTQEPGSNEATHSQALLASPAYASPEQLRTSRDVDTRSDIWSLGVILYQCLTGDLPFDGSTLADVSSRILRDPPVPMRTRADSVPAKLEAIVERCLEKSPEARYPSVDALVQALAPFAPVAAANCLARIRALGPPRRESPVVPRVARTELAGDETVTHPSFERRPAPANARRIAKPAYIAGASILVLGVAMIIVWWSHELNASRRNAPASRIELAGAATPPAPAEPPSAAHLPTSNATAPTLPTESPRPRASGSRLDGGRTAAVRRRGLRPAAPASETSAPPDAPEVVPIERLPLDALIDGRK